MIDSDVFSALTDLLYEAAIQPEKWPQFLRKLRSVLRGGVAALLSQDMQSNDVPLLVGDGHDPAFSQSYEQYYASKNLVVQGSFKKPPGSVSTLYELVDRQTFERSEYYNEWLHPQDLHFGFGAIVQRDNRVQTNLTLLRPKRSGNFTVAELELVRRLAPHGKRALAIRSMLNASHRQRRIADEIVVSQGVGMLLLTARGQAIYVNEEADRILRQVDGIQLMGGRLSVGTDRALARLWALINSAVSPDPSNIAVPGGAMVLRSRFGERLSVLVCPYRRLHSDFDLLHPAAMVFISRQQRANHALPAVLEQLYRLSPAEARLSAALMAGQTLAVYAGTAGISAETARGYLKGIFAKTGTSRQAELVSTLAADPILRLASRQPSE